jgi:hypothetical protein
MSSDNYTPYVALRPTVSVLESTQQAAKPDINATNKDRFFISACATPGSGVSNYHETFHIHLKNSRQVSMLLVETNW